MDHAIKKNVMGGKVCIRPCSLLDLLLRGGRLPLGFGERWLVSSGNGSGLAAAHPEEGQEQPADCFHEVPLSVCETDGRT